MIFLPRKIDQKRIVSLLGPGLEPKLSDRPDPPSTTADEDADLERPTTPRSWHSKVSFEIFHVVKVSKSFENVKSKQKRGGKIWITYWANSADYRQSPWTCTISAWKCTALNQSQLFLKEKLSHVLTESWIFETPFCYVHFFVTLRWDLSISSTSAINKITW